MGRLLVTWVALLALLAATVACTVLLPPGNGRLAASLAIAAAKAGLIVWLFMGLRTDGPLVRAAVLISAGLLGVLLLLVGADVTLRP